MIILFIMIFIRSKLDIKFCRGQGYDDAHNITSEAVGVQKQIKKLCEKAVFTHTVADIT